MTIEMGLVIAIIGVMITANNFLTNRSNVAKLDGAGLEGMKKDIEYMQKDLSRVLALLEASEKAFGNSVRRVHSRIDDHLREEHGIKTGDDGI